ncbi:MAG: glycosyltransferase family 2 protein [Flavobacteriaceae bacterium]
MSSLKIRVILVHYFTPDLLFKCMESIASTTKDSPHSVSVTIVDNGSIVADRAHIDALPATIIRPGLNLGYAAAINRALTNDIASVYVVMNPDMEITGDCIALLATAAVQCEGVAGPRLYLDSAMNFMLPPTEHRSIFSELLRIFARRGGFWERLARRQWRRYARQYLATDRPFTAYDLSGAMLALSAAAMQRVGPFDEGYKLYYEETDWLKRAERAGVTSLHIPMARAVHFYNKSAQSEPRAREWFNESRRRFRRKQYGALPSRVLDLLDERVRPRGRPEKLAGKPVKEIARSLGTEDECWVEIAASPMGFPAASCRCSLQALPARRLQAADLAASLGGDCRITITDRHGNELSAAYPVNGSNCDHPHDLL